jgi:hypothetical protein
LSSSLPLQTYDKQVAIIIALEDISGQRTYQSISSQPGSKA